jgi:hypothetical protein
MVLVRERTVPAERPPLVGEVNANFPARWCYVVSMTDPYGRILGFYRPEPLLFLPSSSIVPTRLSGPRFKHLQENDIYRNQHFFLFLFETVLDLYILSAVLSSGI